MKLKHLQMIETMAGQAQSEYSEYWTPEYIKALAELMDLIDNLEKAKLLGIESKLLEIDLTPDRPGSH